MTNNKPIVCKDLKTLIDKKVTHDVGVLIYQYLNDIEDQIQKSFSSADLIRYYNLRSTVSKNRCVCPFHLGANNPTSLEFNDESRSFYCHCGAGGTYLDFIAQKEGFTKNTISEAKIFAANKFSSISLGFNSISDFEAQLEALIIDRYDKTKSLILNDYFDISLIDYVPTGRRIVSTSSNGNATTITKETTCKPVENRIKEFILEMLDLEKTIREINSKDVIQCGDFKYRIALDIANNSKLIKGFETNSALNSKETLYEFMGKKYDISQEIADKYGLIAFEKSNQSLLEYPDFYKLNDRVLFPFKDHHSGITVGYQARTMNLVNNYQAKYLNVSDFGEIKKLTDKSSRAILPFGIGDFLFNLYDLKNKEIDRLFVTEGVADAIKLLSLGYDCISPGQANLTDHQIYLIYKYFSKDIELFLFYDNDANNTGQNKSLTNAYRLYQFGFSNIKIIRTFAELGTDVTDVATKVRDDSTLKTLINLWINEAHKFEPADDKILNNLYQTGLFTETQLKQIDPRNIEKINSNISTYVEIVNKLNIHGKEIDTLKPLLNYSDNVLEMLLEKIKNLTTSNTKESNDTAIESHDNQSTHCNLKDNHIQNTDDTTSNSPDDSLQENWSIIKNMSNAQLNVLKRRFDYATIKKINDLCNRNQINSIIGKIIKNKVFDINDFIHSRRPDEKSKNTVLFDSDFTPVEEDPDLMPF